MDFVTKANVKAVVLRTFRQCPTFLQGCHYYTANQRLLLNFLINYQKRNKKLILSYECMSKDCGLTVSQIRTAIYALEKDGTLIGTIRHDGIRMFKEYVICRTFNKNEIEYLNKIHGEKTLEKKGER